MPQNWSQAVWLHWYESWREDTGPTKASTTLTKPYQTFLCNTDDQRKDSLIKVKCAKKENPLLPFYNHQWARWKPRWSHVLSTLLSSVMPPADTQCRIVWVLFARGRPFSHQLTFPKYSSARHPSGPKDCGYRLLLCLRVGLESLWEQMKEWEGVLMVNDTTWFKYIQRGCSLFWITPSLTSFFLCLWNKCCWSKD